jgi:hypothetical protein
MPSINDPSYMQQTAKWLREHFRYVIPGCTVRDLDEVTAKRVWEKASQTDSQRRVHVETEDRKMTVFLYGANTAPEARIPPVLAIAVDAPSAPSPFALKWVEQFMTVYNSDIAHVRLHQQEGRDGEHNQEQSNVEYSLLATLFDRAIANTISIDPTAALGWISSMSAIGSLKYEGSVPNLTVVFAMSPNELGGNAVEFRAPIEFKTGLFSEKWLRKVVDGERLALLVLNEKIHAFISLTDIEPESVEPFPFAPHISLWVLQSKLKDQDLAFALARNGDLYILNGHGTWWQRHQRRWWYVDPEVFRSVLVEAGVSKNSVVHLAKMCLDLSFERVGALLCIISESDLDKLVSDQNEKDKVNKPLREALVGLSICTWRERQLVTAAAATDGATILSPDGKILDIACMIADDENSSSFAGARSRAASSASRFGLAIKVSEDGPITVLCNRKTIFELG